MSLDEKSGLWGLLVPVLGIGVGVTVAQFEPVAVAEAAGFSAGLITFLAWCFWHERRRPWLWAYMAIVIAAHGAVIALAPWPEHWKIGKNDGLFGLIDLIVTFGIGYLVSVLANTPKQPRPSPKS